MKPKEAMMKTHERVKIIYEGKIGMSKDVKRGDMNRETRTTVEVVSR